MTSTSINGIVTRYSNYKENDRIITILTPERGRIDAKARGCRKVKSPLVSACQPFVYAEFELNEFNDRAVIQKAEVLESFFPIREDYRKFAIASSMLQLSHEAAREEEENTDLFFLLYHCLSYLAYGTVIADDLLFAFVLKYLDITGYRPSIIRCASCGRDVRGDKALYFSSKAGGTVCGGCAIGAEPISKITLEAMRRILILKNEELQRVVLTEKMREEMKKYLIPHLENSLEYGSRALAVYSQLS